MGDAIRAINKILQIQRINYSIKITICDAPSNSGGDDNRLANRS